MKDPKSFVKLFDLNVPAIEHLDYYINPDTRNFADNDAIEILRSKLPKAEADKLKVSQFEDAKSLSGFPERELILPKDLVNSAERFPESSWQQLIQEDKAFNTPHWLKGYKKVSTELPGSPNASILGRLKQFFDRPPGPMMLLGPSGGTTVKKNMNYYKQLLDSYEVLSTGLLPSEDGSEYDENNPFENADNQFSRERGETKFEKAKDDFDVQEQDPVESGDVGGSDS